MASDTIIVLSASLATSFVGWVLFMYLRNQKSKAKTHVLRGDRGL
jgi:hypothetical protein